LFVGFREAIGSAPGSAAAAAWKTMALVDQVSAERAITNRVE
jgi:hypothetical protein